MYDLSTAFQKLMEYKLTSRRLRRCNANVQFA